MSKKTEFFDHEKNVWWTILKERLVERRPGPERDDLLRLKDLMDLMSRPLTGE